MLPLQINGNWPALVTPFTKNNTINLQVLTEIIEYLIKKHVNGFYICGTTGQGASMTVEERKLVAEKAIEIINSRVPSIIHIGGHSLKDTINLASHAKIIGATGISSIIPSYCKDNSQIISFYNAIINSVNDIPFFPYIIGKDNPYQLMKNLIHIPQIYGTKFTSSNLYELKKIIDLKDEKWHIFYGMDEQYLYGLMSGCIGHIGSTLNFMPGVYNKIRKYFLNGDIVKAQDLQNNANKLTSILISFGFEGALAEILRLIGFNCGTPRHPHNSLSISKNNKFLSELKKVNYDKLISL